VAEGENSRWRRLSRSVFFQKYSFGDISQTGSDIKDPSSKTIHDMEENNISKYRSDPTMKGGVIAVAFSAINMSFL